MPSQIKFKKKKWYIHAPLNWMEVTAHPLMFNVPFPPQSINEEATRVPPEILQLAMTIDPKEKINEGMAYLI
jgi:hypothetical protein